MAGKVPQFDLDGVTTDDMLMLAEVIGCETVEEVQAAFASIEPGRTPIRLMKPLLWMAHRLADPTFTYEQAGAMPLTALIALVDTGEVTKPKARRKKA